MKNWTLLVKARMKDMEVTQEALAEKLGCTQGAVAHWLSGRREPGLDTISKMLGILNMPPMLIGSAGDIVSNVLDVHQPYRAERDFPLISWIAAGNWAESCDNFQPGDADTWIRSDANAGPNGYWLEVCGPSMLPTFTSGMRILVRPEGFDLVNGKFYVAKLLETGETTFKQLLRDGGSNFLQPLNPAFPVIPITESVEIIGLVVDARLPNIF